MIHLHVKSTPLSHLDRYGVWLLKSPAVWFWLQLWFKIQANVFPLQSKVKFMRTSEVNSTAKQYNQPKKTGEGGNATWLRVGCRELGVALRWRRGSNSAARRKKREPWARRKAALRKRQMVRCLHIAALERDRYLVLRCALWVRVRASPGPIVGHNEGLIFPG